MSWRRTRGVAGERKGNELETETETGSGGGAQMEHL
jgi:hypothetical protein